MIQVCGDEDVGALGHGWTRLSQRGEWYSASSDRCWRPPTDVFETDEAVVVKVEIAGMQESDLHVSFENRRLTISGRRKDPTGKIIYQNMEIRYGEFRTEVLIGWALDEDAIRADYEDGFLFVYLPKNNRQRHVPIKSVEE